MTDIGDGFIYVDYAHMSNGVDDMVAQTQAIATTLSTLQAEINQLKSQWVGQDRDAYDRKQTIWDNAVGSMGQIISGHARLLAEISDSYRGNENKLAQMWSEVRIG